MDIVYAVVLVGVLIFVHELGHFAWAKFFGVKVLTFSLGFGPRLASFRKGDTEYRVGVLPLGGYVRMLGENPLDRIPEQDAARAFHAQALFKKVIIVVAGPAMNLAFPIVLYMVVFLGDSMLPPAVIGTVFPHRPAYGALEPGDRVLKIDGQEVETFYEVNRLVEDSAGQALEFEVERAGQPLTVSITPSSTRVVRELEIVDEVGRIGVTPHHPLPVIGVTSPSSPASGAQLRTFDLVVAAGGEPIRRYIDLERLLDRNRGSLLPLTYLRPRRLDGALGGLVELEVYEPHVAALTPEPGTGSGAARAGIELADLFVSHLKVGSPELRMGLLPGDRLLQLDGQPIMGWATFVEDLKAGRGREHRLRYRRGDELREGAFSLRHERGVTEYGQRFERYDVGMSNWVPVVTDPPTDNPIPLRYALDRALRSTRELVELTVFTVVRLVEGRLTVKSIGGPISIFAVAGTAAREGTLNYLALMAFISINLGLINLLPIPMLDGGHLMFFFVEAITRRPVNARFRQLASLIGFAFLLFLMVVAFKNDIERQWPALASQHGSVR